MKQKHYFYRVADTIKLMFLFYVYLLKIKFADLNLLLFCLNKDHFWFLLMRRTSSAEVWQMGNANCSAPKTVIWVTMVANEKYLPYLKLCVQAFL